jgi:hypothetical protein
MFYGLYAGRLLIYVCVYGVRGGAFGCGIAILTESSRVSFPMGFWDFAFT